MHDEDRSERYLPRWRKSGHITYIPCSFFDRRGARTSDLGVATKAEPAAVTHDNAEAAANRVESCLQRSHAHALHNLIAYDTQRTDGDAEKIEVYCR